MDNVIQLRAKAADGSPVSVAVKLSAENQAEAEATVAGIERYVEAKQAEAVAPIEARAVAAEAEAKALRDVTVGEVVRLKQLASTEGEKFDAEAEVKYLSGLPADRLALELSRAQESAPAPKVVATSAETNEPESLVETEDV